MLYIIYHVNGDRRDFCVGFAQISLEYLILIRKKSVYKFELLLFPYYVHLSYYVSLISPRIYTTFTNEKNTEFFHLLPETISDHLPSPGWSTKNQFCFIRVRL